MRYRPAQGRYEAMQYRKCGSSGLRLPAVSLGLWQNFGEGRDYRTMEGIVLRAFDLGVTYFDLANNYGPPPGEAERSFGKILSRSLGAYRDEILVASKAGYGMWPGPYGDWGSRKYLLASLDQSLTRMGLDYVDIFYHHRRDPETPMEESLGALAQAVRQGKALYAGVSNYGAEDTIRAAGILADLGVPCLVNQPRYSMLDRRPEEALFQAAAENGMGLACFSPLARGQLGQKRLELLKREAANPSGGVKPEAYARDRLAKLEGLSALARERGQSLSQLALTWALRDPRVSTVIVGASAASQLEESVAAAGAPALGDDELRRIDALLEGIAYIP
jgi:L-glyceraldehyde 3-phosphate reductase